MKIKIIKNDENLLKIFEMIVNSLFLNEFTYLNGLCGRGFGVEVDFGTVGV